MEIVVDFDGTLALGDTTDISTMHPNLKLIEYINTMYDDGNIIKIVTARGSKSCKTYEEREVKYLNIIKKWLLKYNIKYTNISFFKEYGDVYIDDRCHYIDSPIVYKNYNTKFTNNNVKRFNEKVFKVGEAESISNEIKWFKYAKTLDLKIPTIFSYDVNTISMTFHETLMPYTQDVPELIKILTLFKNTQAASTSSLDTYKQRIVNYINKNSIIEKEKFIQRVFDLEIPCTFNHGDFSTQNILHTDNGLVLIDPIFSETLYQSYQIDIAKFLFTILFFEKNSDFYERCRSQFCINFKINTLHLDTLIACEAIRVANRKTQLIDVVNSLVFTL